MNDTDKIEIERIIGNLITACYDVNQTKPGVIKVVDTSMADIQALITQARIDELQQFIDKPVSVNRYKKRIAMLQAQQHQKQGDES